MYFLKENIFFYIKSSGQEVFCKKDVLENFTKIVHKSFEFTFLKHVFIELRRWLLVSGVVEGDWTISSSSPLRAEVKTPDAHLQ